MYRHLLVPVDNSVLSAANAESAVHLAQRLGARITFLHATPDLAATRSGAMLRATDPQTFAESAFGDAHALLSRCAAAADAARVPCETQSRTSDHPAETIIETARTCDCDLIVMASHGHQGLSGWLHNSHTERVLRQSPVALLVTRVASSVPLQPREQALAVMHDEHESIASVVLAMRSLVQQARDQGAPLDLPSLEAMLAYLHAFPRQMHAKEAEFLHRALRERAPQCEAFLQDIDVLQQRQQALTDAAIERLQAVMSEQGAERGELIGAALALADLAMLNISRVEQGIWPMARQHLLDEDWSEIAAAFQSRHLVEEDEMSVGAVRRLFMRIASLRSGKPLPAA